MADTIDKVQCMRGQRAGHIARMSNTRWAKVTSEWTPREGRRARGRPKRRWRDSIEEVGGSQWMRVAQDQSACRELWRPSARSGMNGRDYDDYSLCSISICAGLNKNYCTYRYY